MTPKQRFLTAIQNKKKPDRLPVTTHHIMQFYLDKYLGGISDLDFFHKFSIDPIRWLVAHKPDASKGEYCNPEQTNMGFLEAHIICNDQWKIRTDIIPGQKYDTKRFNIITPEKTLSMILQSNVHTTWIAEHLIKEKSDLDVVAKYLPAPKCDVEAVNKFAAEIGDSALLRSHICCFDGYGQPGCWQDLACLFGIQDLIMASFEDPEWVHAFLKVLQERKLTYIRSLKGAKYDLLELGGGDASTTVISPDIFDTFVAPYDVVLIDAIHDAGQRVVYHTCGGMMPILENIAAMKPDAMETFTPVKMGGDTNLREAKKRIGDKVCMIGGFDQFNFFLGCSPEDTRKEVRRCFNEAGENGGFILSPSDHFFDADPELILAYSDEARKCIY
jgi:uroporphyrinogen decarboxylase